MTCKINLWCICNSELKWNTCLCEVLYTCDRFSFIRLNPVFLLMLFRNKMQKCINLILDFENSIFVFSFLIVVFLKKMCVVLIGLGVWFLYQACLHLVKIFKDFNALSLLHFQRLQCLQSFTFSKTSTMSSVFYIFKDFNIFSLLHFQRLQCLQSFIFSKTSMSFVFYIFKTPISFVFYIFKDFKVYCLLRFPRLQCLLFCTFKDFNAFILHFFKDFNVFSLS